MRFTLLSPNRRVRQALTLLLLAGALACMFPPQNPAFQWWAAHSAWVSLGYVGMGMVLLLLDRTRLMFVCLGCAAAVSLYANEQELRRRAFGPETQPALKFACLHNPDAGIRETVSLLLDRGIDAFLIASNPGNPDSALLTALEQHYPFHVDLPGDSLVLRFYTRLPRARGADSLHIEARGAWIPLQPAFATQAVWVYVAGSAKSEVRGPKSDSSQGGDSSQFAVRSSQGSGGSGTSDFGPRTSDFDPPRTVIAMGRQADMDLLVRAASGGWTDSYVCQKTDEKGVKYPFHFRIYHAPDIDCIQSDMLRLSDRSYLGIESTLRLRHEPSTPL